MALFEIRGLEKRFGANHVLRGVDLDIHRVDPPAEDAHLHHDVRFVVLAPPGAVIDANHESEAQRWAGLECLDLLGADAGLRRLAANGLALARSLA